MDSVDEVINAATIGDLDCGCAFDVDGIREVGEWLTCRAHRAPARVVQRTTVTTGGLITG